MEQMSSVLPWLVVTIKNISRHTNFLKRGKQKHLGLETLVIRENTCWREEVGFQNKPNAQEEGGGRGKQRECKRDREDREGRRATGLLFRLIVLVWKAKLRILWFFVLFLGKPQISFN